MQNNNISIAVIAIVAALALLGVVAVTIVTIPLLQQEAEAAKSPTGSCASFLKNASAQHCHR
jgi:Flp pilus assembly protein CpaB